MRLEQLQRNPMRRAHPVGWTIDSDTMRPCSNVQYSIVGNTFCVFVTLLRRTCHLLRSAAIHHYNEVEVE
jgi:hypothetical protein